MWMLKNIEYLWVPCVDVLKNFPFAYDIGSLLLIGIARDEDKRKVTAFKWIFRNKLKAILCATTNRGKYTLAYSKRKQVNNNSNYDHFVLATVECEPQANIHFKVSTLRANRLIQIELTVFFFRIRFQFESFNSICS